MYGIRVADLEARGTDLRLRYTRAALDLWPTNIPLVSCSMPLSRAWHPARVFMRGLLPEGDHLRQVAAAANVAASDTFGLLARYGRDVAGALVVTGHDSVPDESTWSDIAYTSETLLADIAAIEEKTTAWIHDDSELSLAGLQNKLLLVERRADSGERWARPVGGQPSTHILKLDDPIRPGLVAAEYHALRLAQDVGLSTLEPEQATLGERAALIVRRYDRQSGMSGTLERVHQEDVCQALRFDHDANRGKGKYEVSGGPSLRDVAGLLQRYGADPTAEMTRLLQLTTLNVVVGNADAHGKNLSVLLARDGHIRMAPAYDLVPTVLWPNLRRRPAMTVNGRTDITAITTEDLVSEGARWGLNPDRGAAAVLNVVEAASNVVIQHDGLAQHVQTTLGRLNKQHRGA
jgi:serine/threonine-protein kinase HipA